MDRCSLVVLGLILLLPAAPGCSSKPPDHIPTEIQQPPSEPPSLVGAPPADAGAEETKGPARKPAAR